MCSNITNAKNPGTSSEKSGSIGQLHNQFADIGFSQTNIVKNNSFDSAPNA